MATNVSDTIALLETWAKDIADELQPSGVYVFGSLIYRNGQQFGGESDVDLIVLIPNFSDGAERADWIEKLRVKKIDLEDRLGHLLRRDRENLICSVVAATALEISVDAHKSGAAEFFSNNEFFDLLSGQRVQGLPGAGARKMTERLVLECVRFAQKQRNAFLGANALGDETLVSFTDKADPAPKAIMRHAAMVNYLEDDGDGNPGDEFDVNVGADYLTVMLHERRVRLDDLRRRFAIRRGGRGERGPLSSKDQLILSELVFDAAIRIEERKTLVASQKQSLSLLSGQDIRILFSDRFSSAFPGVEGVKWFEEEDDIFQRLRALLSPPLDYKGYNPVWWTRGHRNLPIRSASISNGIFLMDGHEMKIRRVAAINPGSYNYKFVLLDVAPLPPTGLYEDTEREISKIAEGCSRASYWWEEYGLVDGKHLITRGEFDDAASVIDGVLQSVSGRASLKIRYVTNYNCIICASMSPIMDYSYDDHLRDHLDAMLRGRDQLDVMIEEILRLPLPSE